MDQWMRWFPTCLGEPRRTEASWRAPKRRGSCCGRSWNADLPLGSFSTDRYTEKKKRERRQREECHHLESFLFFVLLFFPSPGWQLPWLSALSLPSVLLSLVIYFLFCSVQLFLLIDCFHRSLSSVFFSLSTIVSVRTPPYCYYPPLTLILTSVLSFFLFLIHLCNHKYPSFCPHIVHRALVSIIWTSLLLQKDSLKCQWDSGGGMAPFITLFILKRNNNNKNKRLDLNGSKGTVNIFLLNYIFFPFYSWATTQSPQEAPLYCIFSAFLYSRLFCQFEHGVCL